MALLYCYVVGDGMLSKNLQSWLEARFTWPNLTKYDEYRGLAQ